jgi:hypothetical protein
MKDFTNGDTLWFITTFQDNSGTPFDPSSTWGRVYDSSSTVVGTATALTRVTTGTYTWDWQSDPGSNATGQGAFEAFGLSGTKIYRRREILFQLI